MAVIQRLCRVQSFGSELRCILNMVLLQRWWVGLDLIPKVETFLLQYGMDCKILMGTVSRLPQISQGDDNPHVITVSGHSDVPDNYKAD